MNDWKSYINQNGDFELPNFLYKTINDLMKQALDMGTLLSDDQYKLRAYKEQTKKLFRNKWFDLAQALEYFGIIEQCSCVNVRNSGKEIYCDVCKGARFIINSALSPNEMREISMFVNAAQDIQVQEKLQKGLMKLLEEM
jgi:hypothetical protein